MTTQQRIRNLAGIIVALSIITAIFTVTFVLTDFIFRQVVSQASALIVHDISSIASLIIIIFGILGLQRIFEPEFRTFAPLMAAMEKIAQGDFSIRLDNPYRQNKLIAELTASLNRMALELDKMEVMRQEFISNVSHEIQSPLTSMRGFAKALHDEQLSVEERNRYLNIIETESTRLSRLSENLLKLASLEAQQTKFEPQPYRLDKQIRDLILVCEPQWTKKAIDMEISLQPVVITADRDLLSQVWMNLLSNSIKFTPQGGTIDIQLQCTQNQVEFKIADTGIGIAAENQQRIFERFYKADSSRTRSDDGGSGLGLSIVQKIIEMHHGTIAVESESGIGTSFIVTLPFV